MKSDNKPKSWLVPVFFAAVLACLFWRSFLPGFVHFNNDGPLGQQNAAWLQLPGACTGAWDDLNVIGGSTGSLPPDIATFIRWTLGPVGFAKFIAPLALFILGLGAWTFFRQLKLSPLAAALGALATMLTSTYFAGACWSVASLEIAIGFDFLALALIMAGNDETPWHIRWTRLALAGLCVGVNVMEAADVGALCSVFIAGFVFFKSLTGTGGTIVAKAARGIGQVAVISVFAGFIAVQTVTSLVGSQIQGIAGTGQDKETKGTLGLGDA